jgi:hypothetical protein
MEYDLKKPADHYQHTKPKDWPKPQPKAKEVLAEMSDDMRLFLLAAAVCGVDPEKIGHDAEDPERFSYHPGTLRALKTHGLVRLVQTKKQRRELWRPTDDGRGLIARHEPRLLHRKAYRNYTHDPRFALPGEKEVMDRAA